MSISGTLLGYGSLPAWLSMTGMVSISNDPSIANEIKRCWAPDQHYGMNYHVARIAESSNTFMSYGTREKRDVRKMQQSPNFYLSSHWNKDERRVCDIHLDYNNIIAHFDNEKISSCFHIGAGLINWQALLPKLYTHILWTFRVPVGTANETPPFGNHLCTIYPIFIFVRPTTQWHWIWFMNRLGPGTASVFFAHVYSQAHSSAVTHIDKEILIEALLTRQPIIMTTHSGLFEYPGRTGWDLPMILNTRCCCSTTVHTESNSFLWRAEEKNWLRIKIMYLAVGSLWCEVRSTTWKPSTVSIWATWAASWAILSSKQSREVSFQHL